MLRFVLPGGRALLGAASSLLFSTAAAAQCGLDWQPGAPVSGPLGQVLAVATHPNGDLIAGGGFRHADSAAANRIARWDGTAWQALGAGLDGAVNAVVILNNLDVIAGGNFLSAGGIAASRIARWDGSTWHALGSGCNGSVMALLQLANGDLLAAGSFTAAGGAPANRIALWDGNSWSAVGDPATIGLSSSIAAVAQRSNGDIIAAGSFAPVGGTASGLASWNGTSWSTIPGPTTGINALARMPNGDLALAGQFVLAGTLRALALWNGTLFTPLVPPVAAPLASVRALANGDLLVGGGIAALPGPSVARFDGSTWTALANGAPLTVRALTVDAAGRPVLGTDASSSIYGTGSVSVWDGSAWQTLGAPVPPQILAAVRAPDGGVVVGGRFATLFGTAVDNLARWNGTSWSAIGGGVDGTVSALTFTSNGDLIVSGLFQLPGGGPAVNVARFNGSTWSTLGAGLPGGARSLAATPSGEILAHVAVGLSSTLQRFDGATWTTLFPPIPLVSNAELQAMPNGDVYLSGNWLYLQRYSNGTFTTVPVPSSFVPVAMAAARNGDLVVAAGNSVLRYDGTAWTTLADPSDNVAARAFTFLPDDTLVAVGGYSPGGANVGIARFNGTWSTIDGGFGGTQYTIPRVAAAAGDAGDLFVSNAFVTAGGVVSAAFAHARSTCPASAVPLGSGCTGAAGPLALLPDNRPWVGGTFTATASAFPTTSLGVHAVGVAAPAAPLPLGAPGCSLYVAPILLDVVIPLAGTASTALLLPSSASLAGIVLRTQVIGLEFDTSGALVRLTSTNALDLTIGAL